MNGLALSLFLTTINYITAIFITNFFLLKYFPDVPGIIISVIVLIITSFILGIIISSYASKKNCDKINKTHAIKQGIKHILYAVVGYLIVYFIGFIRNPFLEIFGQEALGYSIAQSFIVVLNSYTATIINYYSSIKVSCKVSQEKIDKNLKKLDKYLDKKPVKKKKELIEIRD